MSLKVGVSTPSTNTWIHGKCAGFSESQDGNTLIAKFRGADGELYSKPYNIPIRLSELNQLRVACGLPALPRADNIDLPEFGSRNMMGYDADIEIFVTQKNNFLNASKFRAIGASGNGNGNGGGNGNGSGNGNADAPGNGEDDLPF